jgi:hypothetical protein
VVADEEELKGFTGFNAVDIMPMMGANAVTKTSEQDQTFFLCTCRLHIREVVDGACCWG